MDFENRTRLDSALLASQFSRAINGWPVGRASIRVRPSRGADFSGSCLYRRERIYVNFGEHVRFPYMLKTYLARAVTTRRAWHKPLYTLQVNDGYQLTLFVFLHEWYHLLIRRARRNTRQKESMCDRFAARYLVDYFGLKVRDPRGAVVSRAEWDFQDLDRFVARARHHKPAQAARFRACGDPDPTVFPAASQVPSLAPVGQGEPYPHPRQLLLFER